MSNKNGLLDAVAGVTPANIRDAFGPVKNRPGTVEVARICHEVNRAWCRLMGDNSQPAWEEAPDWQKDSAIKGVQYLVMHRTATQRDLHMNWLATKQEEGWKWGPVKNPDKKEHNCFCSFENLPWQQQVKDHLFYSIVRALEPVMDIAREASAGERKMGISFNPSYDWRIDYMKQQYAGLFDMIDRFAAEQYAHPQVNDDLARSAVVESAAESKKYLQLSKMLAVEAITR